MKTSIISVCMFLGLLGGSVALADNTTEMIASAESAAPPVVAGNATIKAPDGAVLREGTNGYTCYPQQETMGPMCNDAVWDELIDAMVNKRDFQANSVGISYMLAGEGTALGVSNSDPYLREPKEGDDWVKEGPHLMIVVPDRTMLDGLSTDPKDPVYVMWKDTPYAHIMVKIAPE
ncbi:hypothetical protein [Desulfosediminicola sp.]|uniref:hypothetical protein n=1 Tax=Desulfosediminicola sp. TaxID=2886825 RepID=UPI003AF21F3D